LVGRSVGRKGIIVEVWKILSWLYPLVRFSDSAWTNCVP